MTLTKYYAANRWATAVAGIIDAPEDPRTSAAWGRAIGVGAGTLRNWCTVARVGPRRSLVLARLLRALYKSRARPVGTLAWAPYELLDITDRRTLTTLMAQGGIYGQPRPTIEQFLQEQKLTENTDAIDALRKLLHERDYI